MIEVIEKVEDIDIDKPKSLHIGKKEMNIALCGAKVTQDYGPISSQDEITCLECKEKFNLSFGGY